MGARKPWNHLRRPKTLVTYCGLPWKAEANQRGGKAETCPTCTRRKNRGQ